MSPQSQIEPIILWGKGGPNPPKVAILLEELGVPYKTVAIPFSDVKNADYVAINPNGRIPSIQDPNTGLTVWESGAIIEYLIERYDKSHVLSFAHGTSESYLAKQWLFFQTTGQGPYFGQVAWFKKYHPEKLPSAVERYINEVNRITGVLEGHLAKQAESSAAIPGKADGPWLVGDKYSFADLAFFMYQTIVPKLLDKSEYDEDKFPQVKNWLSKMSGRESVKRVLAGLAVPDGH